MKSRFLGAVCILYSAIIIYVWSVGILKNFLAPTMQIYLKVSVFVLIIIGLNLLASENNEHNFKKSNLILLLPVLMLIFAGNGRLTTNFAKNRVSNYTKTTSKKEIETTIEKEEKIEEEVEEIEEPIDISNYDFSKPDFEVVDENYNNLEDYFSFVESSKVYKGKTIKLKGFTLLKEVYIPDGYFAIGKYAISCCAADAGYVGFIAKYDKGEIKDNTWYEIEGVLTPLPKNKYGLVMGINVVNLTEIDGSKEEQYVYPCYSYGDGTCKETEKYKLQ